MLNRMLGNSPATQLAKMDVQNFLESIPCQFIRADKNVRSRTLEKAMCGPTSQECILHRILQIRDGPPT